MRLRTLACAATGAALLATGTAVAATSAGGVPGRPRLPRQIRRGLNLTDAQH